VAREIIFPHNPFLRALVIIALVVSLTDAAIFYAIWHGRTRITPLVVISVIVITMIPIAINLWVHVFRYLGKGSSEGVWLKFERRGGLTRGGN